MNSIKSRTSYIFVILPIAVYLTPLYGADTIEFLTGTDIAKEFRLPTDKVEYARQKINTGKKHLTLLYNNQAANILTVNRITSQDVEKAKGEAQKEKNEQFLSMQQEYLDAIIAICWALFDKAVAKDQPFTGGTIVVIDNGHKLYDFLFEYAKRTNSQLLEGNLRPLKASKNCYAYSRASSHFPELQKRKNYPGQFGIDVRYGEGLLEPLLPANKQHILFGKLIDGPQNLTFVKMETYGLCKRDGSVLKHTQAYIEAMWKKATGVHAKGYSRREDVPKDIKREFSSIIQLVSKKDKKRGKSISNEVKEGGIKVIYIQAKTLAKELQTTYAEKAQNLVKTLETKYDILTLTIRRGNEVILTVP